MTLLLTRSYNEWEVDASVDDLEAVVRAADHLGFHHLTASEHVAVPTDVEPRRGKRYYDALATLSYLAAITSSIRLCTNIVVLPYHHPVELLKHYGTLDRLSRGRLILGVGVGSLAAEFDLLGVAMAGRGERADDALRCLRSCWGQAQPVYRGPHYAVDGMVIDPVGVQATLPVWVGGRTRRSLRRSVELGDAWMPFLLTPQEMAEMLAWASHLPAWAEREAAGRPLDVVCWPEPAADPIGNPQQMLDQRSELRTLSVTVFNERFVSRSVAEHVEQMQCYAEVMHLRPAS